MSETFSAEEDAKLQGHVEPRQPIFGVQCRSGQVMNAVFAFRHDAVDLVEPYDAAVITLECAPGDEATVVYCKHESFEERSIPPVKWNIEEHPIAVAWPWQYALRLTGLSRPS